MQRERYDVIKMEDGKCMKEVCRSATLPGGSDKNVECSGHGKCATNDKSHYSCKCDSEYGIFGSTCAYQMRVLIPQRILIKYAVT